MYYDEHRYDNIINLPRFVSSRHRPMSASDRAAQFSPFAALTGYDAAVAETARLTDSRLEPDEDMQLVINQRLNILGEMEYCHLPLDVTYFVPDRHKSGGAYIKISGGFRWINQAERCLVMDDDTRICIDDIYRLEGDVFGRICP